RIIHGGVAIGDLDMPPALQRRERHEQIGRAVAFIFIIITFGLPWLGRDRHTRLGDELLRGLVHANHRTVRIVWPVIDLQHVFHGGYERGAGVRRNDELLPQVRFEKVFFSVRPIVLSLALATMFSSTTLSSSRLNVHRARPFGGSEQARAINLASEAPSKMRVLAEAGECLRVSTASNPSSTSCWRVRAIVARLVFKALAIWLSLQASPASPASAFNRMRAFVNLWAGCLPLRIRLSSRSRSSALSFTTYFFTAISLAATNRLRQYVTEPSIRTFYSLSTTGGTSGYGVFTIDDSDSPLQLVYQLHDLYIQGWRNRSMQLFLHKNSGYGINAHKKFSYSNDYGDLGYSQNTDTINLDLGGVNGALAAAYNAKTTDPDNNYKRVFVNLAIAFAEAVRFSDVMYNVIKGLPITDVSWTDHKDKS